MRFKKLYAVVLAVIPGLLLLFTSSPAFAVSVNYNNLITDAVFDNSSSMNAAQIDSFLNGFSSSCISSANGFRAPDPTGYNPTNGFLYGSNVTAGKVIFDAAQAYNLNPQVLLATMQKEQSLVSGGGGCSKLAYSGAMGYGCPDSGTTHNYSGVDLYTLNGTEQTSVNGTCVSSSLDVGFSRQVIHAAWLLKFDRERAEGNVTWAIIKGSWNNNDDLSTCYNGYMTSGTFQRCPSGSSTFYDGLATIDGTSVQMKNGATAALYDYTPHKSGNANFVSIFTSWFGSTSYLYAADITTIQVYSDNARTALLSSIPTMLSGQTIYFTVTATNTGSDTWSQSFTRLATINPNNRSSVFADGYWLTANRPTQLMQSSVAPGGTGTFEFAMTAPNNDGVYNEAFSIVADGHAWMLDNATFTNAITVSNPYNGALSYVKAFTDSDYHRQIYGTAANLYQNQTVYMILQAVNTGNQTWDQSFTRVATVNPVNRSSAFATGAWMAADRPAVLLNASVPPGGTGTFEFPMTAPSTNGTYTESFQLVADGQTNGWMPAPTFTETINVGPQPPSYLAPGQKLRLGQAIASADGRYVFVMEWNGDVAIWSQNRQLWDAHTGNKGASEVVMQGDGNLVIYSNRGKVLWTSHTPKRGTSTLNMQTDGNLVLYTLGGRATWGSGTNGKW